jgi:hypothetical protein
MSFMPSAGTIVKMLDGRVAIVSSFSPDGRADKVMFPDGHEESTDAWQIAKMLTDENEAVTTGFLAKLRDYVRDVDK